MSLRLPRDLSTGLSAEGGASALERALFAEKAASLGHAGRMVETSLGALAACRDASRWEKLLQAAADAAYGYMIQRELCGLFDHAEVVDHYGIPRDVLARMGARPSTNAPSAHRTPTSGNRFEQW